MTQIKIFEYNVAPFALAKIKAFSKKNEGKIILYKIDPKALHQIKEGYFLLQIENNKDLHQLKLAMKYNLSTIALLSNIDLLRKTLNSRLKGLLILPFDYAELARIIKDLPKDNPASNEKHTQAIPYNTKNNVEIPNAIKNFSPHASLDYNVNHNLTLREMDLLQSLSNGFLYKEIADLKGITLGTVKQHLHKIYNKLNVNNKIEAINVLNNYY